MIVAALAVATAFLGLPGLALAQNASNQTLKPPPAVNLDGAPEPNPDCAIRTIAMELAGDALDCGVRWTFEAGAIHDPSALSCVIESLETGRSFIHHDAPHGMDSLLLDAVISKDQRIYLLSWDSNGSGGPGFSESLELYLPESWSLVESKGGLRDGFGAFHVPIGQLFPRFEGGRHVDICSRGKRLLKELP